MTRKEVSVVGIGLLWTLLSQTGCIGWGPILLRNQPLEDPAALKAIRSDGFLELDDGTTWRLAGIRMRSVAETKEPDALAHINTFVGSEVEMNQIGDSDLVEAHYRQEHWYFCGMPFLFPHPLTIIHFLDKYQRSSVNCLLVRMGVAEYDHEVGPLPREMSERVAEAQLRYREVLRRELADDDGDEHLCIDYYDEHRQMLSTAIHVAKGDLAPTSAR